MSLNRTSQAVHEMLSDGMEYRSSVHPLGIPKEGAIAVSKKFMRMEEALEATRKFFSEKWFPSSGGCLFCEGGNIYPCPADETYKIINRAIDYDPLSDIFNER